MSSIESVVSICNKALSLIGGGGRISSIDENSKAAKECKNWYTHARDSVLEAHPWKFALTRASLEVDVTAPEYEWDYRFAVPEDVLKILSVSDSSEYKVDWVLEGNYVLCDSTPIYIRYTARVTDTSKFSQGFINCLVAKLAASIAYEVTGSTSKVETLKQDYEKALQLAKRNNGQQSSSVIITRNNWLTSRT